MVVEGLVKWLWNASDEKLTQNLIKFYFIKFIRQATVHPVLHEPVRVDCCIHVDQTLGKSIDVSTGYNMRFLIFPMRGT